MEIKKSHKADLERRRPLFFAVAVVGVLAVFTVVLLFPYKAVSNLIESYFDDYSMDLDLELQKDDDLISAALPEQEKEKHESERLNKVEDAAETPPEELDEVVEKEANHVEAEEDEIPPVNLNGDDPEKLHIVEQLPQFPGGMVEFMKWLTAQLHYPEVALKRGITGTVAISFIVETDGALSTFKVERGGFRPFEAEAMRVAHLMPKWEPGYDEGKPCRTKIAIPIVFDK